MDTTNNTGVIPDPDPVRAYADEAVALLAHVDSVEDQLDALRGEPQSTGASIAAANNEIGAALKIADVYSNLAIAEAIDKLAAKVGFPLDSWQRHYLDRLVEGDPHR